MHMLKKKWIRDNTDASKKKEQAEERIKKTYAFHFNSIVIHISQKKQKQKPKKHIFRPAPRPNRYKML